MKLSLIAIIGILQTASLFAESKDREFIAKQISLTFPSSEEAHQWSLASMSFEDWIKTVSLKKWIILHKSQTKEFFFAVFRSGDHLVFCKNDRSELHKSASTSLRAVDDPLGYTVWEMPSKWTSIEHKITYPKGSYTHSSSHSAYKIKEGFTGVVEVSYSSGVSNESRSKVFRESVKWTNPAEPQR